MTHIYPNETKPDKIWIGDQMMMLNSDRSGTERAQAAKALSVRGSSAAVSLLGSR